MRTALGAALVVVALLGGAQSRAEQPTSATMKHDARRTTDKADAKAKRGTRKAKAKTKSVGKRTADGLGTGAQNAGNMMHRAGTRLRDKAK